MATLTDFAKRPGVEFRAENWEACCKWRFYGGRLQRWNTVGKTWEPLVLCETESFIKDYVEVQKPVTVVRWIVSFVDPHGAIFTHMFTSKSHATEYCTGRLRDECRCGDIVRVELEIP